MNNNSFPQIKHQDSKSGEAKEIERLGKPLWIANFIAKMPCVTFWVLFLILSALVVIPLVGGELQVNNFNDTEDQEASYQQQEKGNGEMTTYLIYKKKEGETLLTVKNLEQIQKIEKKLTTMRESEWEEMCEIDNQKQFCNKFHSISQIVLGEEGFEIEVTQEKIDLFLQKVENNQEFYKQVRQLFEEDFRQNNTDVSYARSIYYFGMPFEGFNDYKDKDEKQLQKFKDWNKELYDYIDEGQGNEDMEVWYYNSLGSEDYQERELNNGLLFALFSFVYIFIYVCFHLKSVFLGLMGSILVLMSFPAAFFIYNYVFQIDYFVSIHMAVIFLVMGIGADDIFVFYDCWRQAKQTVQYTDNLQKMLSYTYRRAAITMLVTTSTTVISFLATALTPIMPIMAFGIFAAINIVLNYIIIIFIFPCLLVWCEKRKIQKKNKKQKYMGESKANINIINVKESDENQDNAENKNQVNLSIDNDLQQQNYNKNSNNSDQVQIERVSNLGPQQYNQQQINTTQQTRITGSTSGEIQLQSQMEQNEKKNCSDQKKDSGENKSKKKGFIKEKLGKLDLTNKNSVVQVKKFQILEKFFFKYWTYWMYKARWFVVFIFLGFLAFSVYGATQLTTPNSTPTGLPEGHFFLKAQEAIKYNFYNGASKSLDVYFVWGIKDLDREGVGRFEPGDKGSVIWDNNFDISGEKSQKKFIDICEDLKSGKYGKLVKNIDNNVSCFMNEFREYVLEERQVEFPVQKEYFNYYFSQFMQSDFSKGVREDEEVGFFDGELRYVSIKIVGDYLKVGSQDLFSDLYDKYNKIIQNYNQESLEGMSNGYQTSTSWLWLVTQGKLIKGALQGILLSIALAFVIITLSTKNIILSFYAIFSIIGVILGVLMVIWAEGWEFGTFQSMNSIFIIGLSVDYVVHLVNAYTESLKKKRYQKTQFMLTVMGVSILGGAITTLGAGLFLFGGQLRFFQIMGVFVSVTIGFSLLWSLCFFVAVCHIGGVQGRQGDISFVFGWVGKLWGCIGRVFKKIGCKQQKNDNCVQE